VTSVRARAVELPQGEQKHREVQRMFDRIAPRYDRVNRVISLGQDRRWRRHTVQALRLPPHSSVLDLACGTGDLCEDLITQGLRPVGVDFSAGMLAAARTSAPLLRADALRLPFADASVDGVVTGFALRNFTDLSIFFGECARVLRPGGRLAALDAAEPSRLVLRLGHDLWFRRVVPLVGARLSHDRDAYRYLPQSTAYLPAAPELLRRVAAAGFASIERATFTGGAVQLITGTRS
jgi:demethylmenaquinone methyltransferase / 2-methoxy-6-polyprenyl-1,4-benzoquinol methylase